MGVDVSNQIVIAKPRLEVALYASDPANAPQWYSNIQSVEWVTLPGKIEPGAQMKFIAHFMGRILAYTYEITECDPGRKMVMRTAEGPFPMETTYLWEDADGRSTRMTLANRGEPHGFKKVAAPLMGMAVGRANKKDLEALKQILENR